MDSPWLISEQDPYGTRYFLKSAHLCTCKEGWRSTNESKLKKMHSMREVRTVTHSGWGPLLVRTVPRDLSARWLLCRPDDCDGARKPRCCTPIRHEHARPLISTPANCKTPTKPATTPAPANSSTSSDKQTHWLPREGSFTQSLEECLALTPKPES